MDELQPIGWRHLHWETTDSTNNRALEWSDEATNSGMIFTAEVQTQGRGQHGRRWQSAVGTNVLLSVLLFPPKELCRPPLLTAITALALSNVVETLTSQTPRVKWPNDIYVNHHKVCGILTEGGVRAGQTTPYFVVGLGLNVNTMSSDFQEMQLPHATSLRELKGAAFEITAVRQCVIQQLNAIYQQALRGEWAALEGQWAARIGLLHHYVTVEFMDASEVQGTLIELSFQQLTILQAGHAITLRPEEIRHVR